MNELEQEIQFMRLELAKLKAKIDGMRCRIRDRRFFVQSPLMAYLTKTQYDYMNWYSEALEKRIKLMEEQAKRDRQMRLPS